MTEDERKEPVTVEEENPEWEAYKGFVRTILSVPKEEIDRREAEEKARKKPA